MGDNASIIGYHILSRQIEEGLQFNFTQSEIIQAVLHIIKPGHIKDMLINKIDPTVDDLKSGSESFQNLMSTKQYEDESLQQFLYMPKRLKQKVIFTSRQASTDIEYEPSHDDSLGK